MSQEMVSYTIMSHRPFFLRWTVNFHMQMQWRWACSSWVLLKIQVLIITTASWILIGYQETPFPHLEITPWTTNRYDKSLVDNHIQLYIKFSKMRAIIEITYLEIDEKQVLPIQLSLNYIWSENSLTLRRQWRVKWVKFW